MKCPLCGKEIADGSRFCKYCGADTSSCKSSGSSERSFDTPPINGGDSRSEINEVSADLTKGCKIWFWIVLVVNALSALSSLTLFSRAPGLALIGLVSGAALAAGSWLILFRHKKIGFYMIVGMAAIILIYYIANGAEFMYILGAIINPAISYYFVNKNSDVIE